MRLVWQAKSDTRGGMTALACKNQILHEPWFASFAGLKILDGPITDSLEAEAFTKNIHLIDVYSCRLLTLIHHSLRWNAHAVASFVVATLGGNTRQTEQEDLYMKLAKQRILSVAVGAQTTMEKQWMARTTSLWYVVRNLDTNSLHQRGLEVLPNDRRSPSCCVYVFRKA